MSQGNSNEFPIRIQLYLSQELCQVVVLLCCECKGIVYLATDVSIAGCLCSAYREASQLKGEIPFWLDRCGERVNHLHKVIMI